MGRKVTFFLYFCIVVPHAKNTYDSYFSASKEINSLYKKGLILFCRGPEYNAAAIYNIREYINKYNNMYGKIQAAYWMKGVQYAYVMSGTYNPQSAVSSYEKSLKKKRIRTFVG
jgi:hypothetical protein